MRLPWALTVCEFYRDCRLYRRDSYTCNKGDQEWCGEYKNRKYGKVIPQAQAEQIVALLQEENKQCH